MNGISGVQFSGISTAKVAFAPDLDETFHDWVGGNRSSKKIANPRGLRAQNRFLAERQQDIAVIFNTSNTLRDMKKRIDLLQGAPLDGLILGNGKQVFINYAEKPAEEWLGELSEADSETEWDATVTNISNWSLPASKTVIRQTLLEEGYKPESGSDPDDLNGPLVGNAPDGTPIRFEFLDTHSAFDLIVESDDDATRQKGEAETNRLAKKIKVNLERYCGMSVEPTGFDMPVKEGGHLFVRDMAPAGVHKGSALQYALKKIPNLEAVITAGDNELNDPQAMTSLNYLNANGELVPNLPVAMPERPAFVAKVGEHPNVVWSKPGSMNPAIKRQLKKINLLG